MRYLTSFYLVIAAGGAAGGIFVGIIAPYTFHGYYELHIGIYACALLILIVLGLDRHQMTGPKLLRPVVWVVLIASVSGLGVVLVQNATRHRDNILSVSRNFYGVLRVRNDDEQYGTDDEEARPEPTHELLNGRIQHGFQFLNPKLKRIATSYYGVTSGVGRVLSLPSDGPRHVGLVGLGTGTLATYARKGDHFQFYEINSKVEELARKYFTYLDDCQGEVEIIHGDVRVQPHPRATAGFQPVGARRIFGRRDSRALAHARGVCHLSSPYGPRRDHCRPHLQQALCPRAGGAGDRRRLPPGDGDDRRALLDGRRFVLELGVGFRLAPRYAPS